MTELVPSERDFRFASTQGPEDIHGGNPGTHPGKAMVQVATIQVAVNDLLEVRPPESVRPFEPLLVDPNKGFKMLLHAPVRIRRLRISGTVNGGRLSSVKKLTPSVSNFLESLVDFFH